MRKLPLAVFVFSVMILSIGFSSALVASDLGTFKSNESVELYQTCSNCSFVNVSSVKVPNSTVIKFNEPMIQNFQDYTFLFNDTSDTGLYIYNTCGDLDGTLECEDIQFTITKTGFNEDTSKSIVYLTLLIFATLLFLGSMWSALKLPFGNQRDVEGSIVSINNLKYVKILMFSLAYILLTWVINLLHSLANNFDIMGQFIKLFETLIRVLTATAYPLFVFIFVFSIFLILNDLKLNKLITEGFRPN